ncbi:MAG: UDP-2,3-diacylglucosamine diphosphatase [Gammaproteobacteria bacterium]|nr:UDP-2,3-diacylglucosamine diphosphatase [Gammaproteobacteria bacterium]MDH3768802.1 UDP-2,3-diacylglucosamine diphosphatase [Gammaproteobacteria bacterium]
MSVIFVSDLHLDAKRPEIGKQFLAFLEHTAPAADVVYILGDLFESWVGDDDPQPEKYRVADALRKLSGGGTPCYFMCGNRDFLVGNDFAANAGLGLLEDEVVIEIHGQQVLLMHGDSLCTDDLEYQAFRKMVRDADWQHQFLALPLEKRLATAAEARRRSIAHNAEVPETIMDVSQQAVVEVLQKHGVATLLHGHTHRPAVHEFLLDGKPAKRIVLGDWYDQGSIVTWDQNGPRLEALPR